MSGTEAVMQACNLARFHTQKDKIVTFSGSYHGWWDGVHAGFGSVRKNKDSFMLAQESPFSLATLRFRRDVAAVIVNPLHILYPNKPAPTDGFLFGKRITPDVNEARIKEYTSWLHKLREICTKKNIALIFDEVYVGHRLGWGGAQSYFEVSADIVTYGKSFGGGLPVGIVCASKNYGSRVHSQKPLEVLLARGTFQGHPYLVASMLKTLEKMKMHLNNESFSRCQSKFKDIAQSWNKAFSDQNIPMSVSHFESIFSFNFHHPSPYNWLFLYFLRDHGVYVSSIPGLGRAPLPLNFSEEQANIALSRIIKAAHQMKESCFWAENNRPKSEVMKIWVKQVIGSNA